MQKGQTGTYITETGTQERGKVLRVRGAHRVDVDGGAGAWIRQMVPVGEGPGCFRPDGFDHEHAPPPPALTRLVPRYVPVWHVFAVCLPSSVAAAALTTLVYHLLGGK